jgi:hypothetical protein
MYTQVSKCKNDKKNRIKEKNQVSKIKNKRRANDKYLI